MAISSGAKFAYETTAGGGLYTDLATEVLSITGPSITVGDVDQTVFDSPSSFREFVPGLGDGGEVSIELLWKKATLNTLYGLIRSERKFRISFPDTPASTWIFDGYLKAVGTEMPDPEEKISNTFTFKITKKPTFTAG